MACRRHINDDPREIFSVLPEMGEEKAMCQEGILPNGCPFSSESRIRVHTPTPISSMLQKKQVILRNVCLSGLIQTDVIDRVSVCTAARQPTNKSLS